MNNICPHKIRDTIEIAPIYLRFLLPLIKSGTPIDTIFYAPAPRAKQPRKEYVYALHGDNLLYLERQENGLVKSAALHRANIFALRLFGGTASATILLYFMQDGKLQRLMIPFECEHRALYEELLLWCMHMENAELSAVVLPEALTRAHPVIHTLALDAALLGDAVGTTDWWSIKANALLSKQDSLYACALKQMRRGQALFYTHGGNFNSWLLINGRAAAQVSQGAKTQTITITIGGETVGAVEHLFAHQNA